MKLRRDMKIFRFVTFTLFLLLFFVGTADAQVTAPDCSPTPTNAPPPTSTSIPTSTHPVPTNTPGRTLVPVRTSSVSTPTRNAYLPTSTEVIETRAVGTALIGITETPTPTNGIHTPVVTTNGFTVTPGKEKSGEPEMLPETGNYDLSEWRYTWLSLIGAVLVLIFLSARIIRKLGNT